MGFEFHWPWMALLITAPLLARLFWPRGGDGGEEPEGGERQTLLHPSIAQLSAGFGGTTPRTPIAGTLHALALWALWLALTAAMMRPQWLEPHTESRGEGYDLMLAVDASHSMEALDFTVDERQVTRMAVLKGVMDRFIANRAGDRVGLILFGSHAYTVAPLTHDLDAVRRQLADVVPNIAGQGTAMGDAIGLGVAKLRERPEGSRVLILVADGDNTAGTIPPLEAARLAAREKIRVYAIGVGSDQKEVWIHEGGRLVSRDDLGLDEGTLRGIAQLSDGAYLRATDTHALEEIYRRIDQLEKSRAESRSVLIPHPLYHWPLGVALVIALLLGLFPEARLRLPVRRDDE